MFDHFPKIFDNSTTFMIDIEIQSIGIHNSYQNNDTVHEEIIHFDQ